MICRHCHLKSATRPRGLCWTCYNTDGVREKHPSTSRYGRRGPGNFNGMGKLPPFPTSAAPGSPEKVAILEQRAELRQALFHPDDADFFGSSRSRMAQPA
ncbi:MAG: hypothetical protein HY040_12860 [Planctomycetes bacterium]|nr:hypothetical protein [Planctomycetota bacterium]